MQKSSDGDLQKSILEILSQSSRPIGASALHERLLDRGWRLSEPTVGRMLRSLDRIGYTRSEGRLGRLLTREGLAELQLVRDRQDQTSNANDLLDKLRPETLEDIIHILVARRGIEREVARAAALKATRHDIAELVEHDKRIRSGETPPDVEEGLHRRLATAAHNPVLGAVYRLLLQDPHVSKMLNLLLIERRGMSTDPAFNQRLIEAIQQRDPDAAEAAVVDHLDATLDIVRRAWKSMQRTGQKAASDEVPSRGQQA